MNKDQAIGGVILYEGLPTVILEGMSCGIPIVATNIDGNRDAVSHGIDGFLVPPGSPEEMGRRLLTLLEDKEVGMKMGAAGRRKIELRFIWDRVATKILECYELVLRAANSKSRDSCG